ncbi:hypothetical protein G6F46_002552 [Rhizopus delemar]|uniref:Protein kinase domain-containing protein n=3 Tax=Rhizopus TaxID=4842 RepID=I1C4Q6_RHIO9|nr:hypothetical protein RO3G_08141 [Rhizopus delemar RA 99-880]KAG1466767.1 hypothetical protein G6F55_000279 [Rhizopus delemar]KAG1553818.1 hypothetical protein G6F51_000356 [Rhizopus arrhizus]KAG1505115.1 hypothetical protein G6F54_000543 [Rhizopus delemar]KAG1518492.1 hypothetical protein G6F53_000553 [Rhizopus delemar]|eukprot:EIE83436.1 hypothetical protein RO3G_08141 [Rhizopus delemar RA 99-880]
MDISLSKAKFIENLRIIDTLGKGAYGQVCLGLHEETQKFYAIKSLSHRTKQQLLQERMEIGIHARLSDHPHIIELKRVIRNEETNQTHIVMEYCPEGDLFTAITEKGLYAGNHLLIRKVFLQLLDAVSYCHQNGVYHRDLKPENILVFNGGNTVKLTDFGLATTSAISQDYGCGSTFYFSPECRGDLLRGANHIGYATAPNDIWALGVILINLTTGRNPWKQASLQDETFCAYLNNSDFLLHILPISRELNRIIKCIFCIDPARRIGLNELRERIIRCKYFTRTAESDRYERLYSSSTPLQLPPSPPATPNRTRSPSPVAACQKKATSKKYDDDMLIHAIPATFQV